MDNPHTQWRSPRVRFEDAAPAILRAPDGRQQRGKLEVLSLNGGLLNLTDTLEQGSRRKLLFVGNSGPVLSAVEMLPPVSTDRQPFRFVALEKADQGRLRSTVQLLSDSPQDAWIEKYRAATAPRRPERRGFFASLVRSLFLLAV
jgi:hypothetical protein